MSDTLVLIAMLLFSPTESDQDADAAAYRGSQDGVGIYDFEDDEIEGEVLRAEGENLVLRGSPHHASLLKIRTSFTTELTRLTLDM